MTLQNAFGIACLAFIAATRAAHAAEQHNLVLLVPESMQSANVSDGATPALARLRGEGVYFIDSYTGFPELRSKRHAALPAVSSSEGLVAVATSSHYSAALVDEDGAQLDTVLRETLPRFKEASRPFLLVYRVGGLARTMYLPAKSLMSSNPGGDGAAGSILLNTDHALAALEGKLKELGLYDATNIVVAAEHGRSTIWKASTTSPSLELSFKGVPARTLPPGFLALDLLRALMVEDAGLSLYDPETDNVRLNWWAGSYPRLGDATIAVTPSSSYAEIETRGGFDLIYMPEPLGRAELTHRARFIVDKMFSQDYVSGVFVNERRVGRIDGALSIEHLNAGDDTAEQLPDIVVSFVSSTMNCRHPTICAVAVADTPIQEGHDVAVGLSRAETSNFMAARGPDFRANFISRTPASNQDLVRTIEALLRGGSRGRQRADSRILTESLRGGERFREPAVKKRVIMSRPTENDEVTEVHLLSVGPVSYFYAAGGPGRTVGVPQRESSEWRWDWPKWRRFTIQVSPD